MDVQRKQFRLLLGIGLIFYVAEGFVVQFRPNESSLPQPFPKASRDNIEYSLPAPLHAIPANEDVTISVPKKSNTLTARSKITEMSSFLCTVLLEKVATKMIAEDDDGDGIQIDLATMERLLRAMRMKKKNESLKEANGETATTKPTNASVEEQQNKNIKHDRSDIETELKSNGTSTLAEKSSNDIASMPSTLTDSSESAAAGVDGNDNGDRKSGPESNTGVDRIGTALDTTDRSRTVEYETPKSTWTPPPLEVVESNVVPLRPFSVPRKNNGIDEPKKVQYHEELQSFGSDDRSVPPESRISKDEESASSWDKNDAVKVSKIEKDKELFQRSLLQRRFEMEATIAIDGAANGIQEMPPTGTATNKSDGVSNNNQDDMIFFEERKRDELFRRSLLQKRLELEEATRTRMLIDIKSVSAEKEQPKLLTQSEEHRTQVSNENSEAALRRKSQEVFQRSLLKTKLEFDAREEQIRTKKAAEMFHRRLLKRRMELDACSEATNTEDISLPKEAQAEIDTMARTSETFQRKLLAQRLEQDARERKAKQLLHKKSKEKTELESPSIGIKSETTIEVGSEHVPDVNGSSRPIVDDEPRNREIKGTQDCISSLPTEGRERYAREAKISHSYVPTQYNPAWWSTNEHFQTIVGTLFRKETMYSRGLKDIKVLLELTGLGGKSDDEPNSRHPLARFRWDERVRMETKDGDFCYVDWKYADGSDQNENTNSNEKPVCLICHGLESCSDSELAKEFAMACNDQNMDAACLNFRGCCDYGEECNLTDRAYHLGFTDDLMEQIEAIHSETPNRRIYLSGFSLGAAVVTKLLADLGETAYRYNICGAAVNAVPFDTGQCHQNMNEPGIVKTIYGDRLLKSMKRRMKKQYDMGVFAFERSEIDDCETIMDIENLVIAPVFAFDDALDYYDKVKTIDKLHKVSVPELVIQARDDPFFEGLELPDNDTDRPLRILYTDRGGHCGYIFHRLGDTQAPLPTVSWMPSELARFLAHLEETNARSDCDQPLETPVEQSKEIPEAVLA